MEAQPRWCRSDEGRAAWQRCQKSEQKRFVNACFESVLQQTLGGRLWVKILIACEEITETHIEAANDWVAERVREGDRWKCTWE